jgi:hypothetical protein
MVSSIVLNLLFGFALTYQMLVVGFYVNAIMRQPKRLKARFGFWASIFFLIFETLAFAFGRSDSQMGPLLLPIVLIAPFLLSISTYRLYRRWDPKYWDASAPDFLGWNQ